MTPGEAVRYAEVFGSEMRAPAGSALVADKDSIGAILETIRQTRRMAADIDATTHGIYLVVGGVAHPQITTCFDSEFPSLSETSRGIVGDHGRRWLHECGTAMVPRWWAPDGDEPEMPGLARRVPALVPDMRGLALPVFAEPGARGLAVFAGSALTIDAAALCDLHIRCFVLFAAVAHLRLVQSGAVPQMTKRELDCLRLTADGNTSDEIARALGLSKHTADQYLAATSQKLNAMNRMHAVAKALRLGLIE